MTRTKLYVGISIVGILAASTAGATYKEIQRDQACKYKDYFAAHEAECEGRVFLSPFSSHKHDRTIRTAYAEYGGVSSYEQRQVVTVVPDHNAVYDGGSNSTPYMYTQTAANMAMSGGMPPAYGRALTAADAGVRYVNAPAYAYARPHVYAYRHHVHRHVKVANNY